MNTDTTQTQLPDFTTTQSGNFTVLNPQNDRSRAYASSLLATLIQTKGGGYMLNPAFAVHFIKRASELGYSVV